MNNNALLVYSKAYKRNLSAFFDFSAVAPHAVTVPSFAPSLNSSLPEEEKAIKVYEPMAAGSSRVQQER
jgi:hypothetical protein